MRGGVGNASLPACGLKVTIWSAPNETITILCASVIVVVSDAMETKLPAIAHWIFDFVVDFN
jgi:hypothetical protein